MVSKLLRTDWYRNPINKIAMATLHEVTEGNKTYYVINGDTLNLIVDQELALSVYLSNAKIPLGANNDHSI